MLACRTVHSSHSGPNFRVVRAARSTVVAPTVTAAAVVLGTVRRDNVGDVGTRVALGVCKNNVNSEISWEYVNAEIS